MQGFARSVFGRAFIAGTGMWLAATLAVVLFLAPWFAGETNFPGHQHPEGTPDHIHTLEQAAIALSEFTAFIILVVSAPLVLYVLRFSHENPHTEPTYNFGYPRAPPALQ